MPWHHLTDFRSCLQILTRYNIRLVEWLLNFSQINRAVLERSSLQDIQPCRILARASHYLLFIPDISKGNIHAMQYITIQTNFSSVSAYHHHSSLITSPVPSSSSLYVVENLLHFHPSQCYYTFFAAPLFRALL